MMLRTAAAGAAIAAISEALPGFTVGAGTVLSVRQAEEAVAAGARFLVSPGFDDAVVSFARDLGCACAPGCVHAQRGTMRALAQGVELMKFFPAEAAGGLGYLKAVAAPFGALRFVPTGGIGPSNVDAYLRHPQVVACGGSWMVKRQAIADGDFATIGRLTAEAVALAAAAVA